jgi:hypothetical protein
VKLQKYPSTNSSAPKKAPCILKDNFAISTFEVSENVVEKQRGNEEKETKCHMRVSDVALIPVQWVTVQVQHPAYLFEFCSLDRFLPVIVTSIVFKVFSY